ncbi:hypothetical protein QAD02_012121 [Eretmocerus hayati]|uniref:Uncharacterized protein n=1 Tax=Eretmocerus hayati TaxID=131215 RepID=A0ACC2NZ35_9HYME|nr:hypothetical protein QAD02_012121 [Eretmocerus hayati]
MTSKVLVKLPVVPFAQQRKKTMPEIIASVPSRKDDTAEIVDEAKSEILNCEKITQLEQNLKFLQDQHQITLVSLHQEVEILRQKNRDLQYQLVFTKGPNSVTSSPSSPEDIGGNLIVKPKGSPCNINVTPLQVELLEKDLQDLKTSLNDARKRNVYLSEVIEKQKKSLDLAEKVKEGHKKADVAVQAESMLECQQVEMKARLDDAELLVSRLRQENEDQRKEISNLKSSSAHSSNGSRHARRTIIKSSLHCRPKAIGIVVPEETEVTTTTHSRTTITAANTKTITVKIRKHPITAIQPYLNSEKEVSE